MNTWLYNENTGRLETPLNLLAAGVDYAEDNGIRNIKITKAECDIDTEKSLYPLVGRINITSILIHRDIDVRKIDIEPLYSLKNLKDLSMTYSDNRLDFSKFESLETLGVTGADKKIKNINIDGLKKLRLVSTKNLDCKFISELKDLEEIRISGGRVTSLSGIENLHQLKLIRLDHCPSLIDISSICNLDKIFYLYVETCKRLSNFSCLKENINIEELFISNIDSIDFIPTMKKIKFFKSWEVKDGNLAPLLESSSLEKVDIYPQKRNYTHRVSEINNLLKNV